MPTHENLRHLLLVAGGKSGARIPVSRRPRMFGRSPDADVRLHGIAVSRRHAEVWLDGAGQIWVRDLGSSNGTYLDGAQVGPSPAALGGRTPLKIGDYVFMADEPGTETDVFTESNVLLGFEDVQRNTHLSSTRIEAGLLMSLRKFGARLFAEPAPQRRLDAVTRFLVDDPFSALQAAVLRREDDRFVPAAGAAHRRWPADARTVAPPALLGGLLRKWGPISAANIEVPPAPGEDAGRLATVCLCPIDETSVLQATFPGECDPDERMALLLLAASDLSHAEAHWKAQGLAERRAAMEMEISQARKVQKMTLPKAVRIAGLDYWVTFEPCHEVAGDYVDVIPMADGRVLFAIADVCGKGVQAALIASFLHTFLHVDFKNSSHPLGELVDRLNGYLKETMPDARFVTFCIVAWDPSTHRIEWVNAGHPPPMVLAPGGAVRMLEATQAQCPLGIEEGRYVTQAGAIRTGETLVLYTDGMTEIRGVDEDGILGLKRWADLVASSRDPDLRTLDAKIRKNVAIFGGRCAPQEDDQTYLLVRCLGNKAAEGRGTPSPAPSVPSGQEDQVSLDDESGTSDDPRAQTLFARR